MPAWTTKNKTVFTIVGIFLLFLLTGGYDALEWYNANLERINATSPLKLPRVSTPSWLAESFRLGLDLKGGTHLVYDTDLTKVPQGEQQSAVDGVRDVIERRVNAFGVAEPIVQTVKVGESFRVIVELAGIHDVSEAIKLIGDTPLLEFKETNPDAPTQGQRGLTPQEQKELDDFNAAARAKAKGVLDRITKGEDFAKLAQEFSDDAASKAQGGDIGWVSRGGAQEYLIPTVEKMKPGEKPAQTITTPQGVELVRLTETRETDKEVSVSHILICYQGAERCQKDTLKEDAKKKAEELKAKAKPENFAQLAKENSTEPGAEQSGGDLGWYKRGSLVKEFEDAAWALKKGEISGIVETQFGFHVILKKDERPLTEYHVARILFKTKTKEDILPPPDPWKGTGLTGKQLKRAYADVNTHTNLPAVNLEFNDEGKKLFADITSRNVGKPVAIFLDKQPVTTPNVNEAITDGSAVIQGNFTVDEAKKIAQRLNSGALPIPITLASQQTVGATLGAESLEKSLKAGLLGFLLVALFMVFYYRLPGLLAVLALVVYTALALAIFKPFITLSLAGIAGFILSIGMAVDANVLIFERMKEELKWGRGIEGAIANGFKRAWTSIRDSNVSSLITCSILFWFSASLIKGFALTLALGILVSMFTAIAVTRVFLRAAATSPAGKHLWLFGSTKKESSHEEPKS